MQVFSILQCTYSSQTESTQAAKPEIDSPEMDHVEAPEKLL